MTSRTKHLKIMLRASSAALALGAVIATAPAFAQAQGYAIQSEPLGTALKDFALKSGKDVVFDAALVQGKTSPGVRTESSDDDALRQLLADSGLTFSRTASGSFVVQAANPKNAAAASDEAAKPESNAIEEVVVTAEKRAEKLENVPSSVSVITGEHLEEQGLTSLSQYANYVPGLDVIGSTTPGTARIILQGISTNDVGQPPLAGVYIDDAPIGSSTGATRASQFAVDLMPYDVQRIEVLRGPQGTLYGSNAMGGILKYVLREPDLDNFQGQAGAALDTIENSSGIGWTVRASITGPLVQDELGFMVSGYHNSQPGYIDNVGLGINGENHSTQDGGRVALLWEPDSRLKVKLQAVLQDTNDAGFAAVSVNPTTFTPVFGNYTRSTSLPENFEEKLQYYALTADYDAGFATLTSATSLQTIKMREVWDLSSEISPFFPAFELPEDAFGYQFDFGLHKWSEELRLASPEGQRLEWLAGFFWTQEDTKNNQLSYEYSSPGVIDTGFPNFLSGSLPGLYWEVAGYADATYKITQNFDISGGVRYSALNLHMPGWEAGLLAGAAPGTQIYYPPPNESAGVVTWSGSASYHLEPDQMLYARVATGYRPGGPNFVVSGVPATYGPDKLIDYEAGFKGRLFDDRLQVDASVFWIDWSHIQLGQATAQDFLYTGNGGSATSKGANLTTSYQLTDEFRAGATVAYTDAALTSDAPAIGAMSGGRLPGSPVWGATITGDYVRQIDDNWTVMAGGGWIYRGSTLTGIGTEPGIYALPAMDHRVDLYAAVQTQRFTVRLYATNVLGDVSYNSLYYPLSSRLPSAAALPYPQLIPDQPRTIGISVDTHF